MVLTQKTLERHGWLFSHSLGLMVREHECGGGKWDVEVDAYTNVSDNKKPCYEPDRTVSYPSYKNLAAVLADPNNADIARCRDWVDGDTVEML